MLGGSRGLERSLKTTDAFSIKWKWFVNVFLSEGRVLRVSFDRSSVKDSIRSETAEKLKSDLEAYFRGEKIDFDYDVVLNLPSFTVNVLKVVKAIPYGKTVTYGEVAKRIGTHPRAIGRALSVNPVPIIIPCHRVIAKNGLGGFSPGLDVKAELLRIEGHEVQGC
jgi:methylated-DNA-[protein]-cysteine S-methyltransferase